MQRGYDIEIGARVIFHYEYHERDGQTAVVTCWGIDLVYTYIIQFADGHRLLADRDDLTLAP